MDMAGKGRAGNKVRNSQEESGVAVVFMLTLTQGERKANGNW
jgi:hypothetical protein